MHPVPARLSSNAGDSGDNWLQGELFRAAHEVLHAAQTVASPLAEATAQATAVGHLRTAQDILDPLMEMIA
ncbi:hypothetical protein [Pseudonocardia sp. ICBG601]|uniref:hypothetical protein n=1 Tax=Pseudonocardia sp. ICBG601 TaxID=2846759 RepID=UPI001CF6071D|nr:hypothetical protein [Pseudonocardia sp. ICBG601]